LRLRQLTAEAGNPIWIYNELLSAWNRRDATAFAANFDEHGEVIGFDGSETSGRASIQLEMGRIFADHETGEYVGIVRSVMQVSPRVTLLRAVAGVVPAGQPDLNPALNSIQRMVLTQGDGRWQIVSYQNTPAQLHGRPAELEKLTNELREARTRSRKSGRK
jgi:uncharacterized protein (TIGR02246 family)